ncbi:uncharacterized protein LOC142635476 [Castanea sativa]|uniref:uncharacterized protein LOC142635476 n=1 Tax=Castanea sativa TaxID=21020 RepID=UPI003F6538E9
MEGILVERRVREGFPGFEGVFDMGPTANGPQIWRRSAHTIYVLTEYLLHSLLKRSDFKGRIAKWGTRLGSFDIRYSPKSLVKGQVLTDFIAEFSPRVGKEMVCPVEVISWKVFVDSASSVLGVGAGIVVITLEGIKLEHSFRLGFKASNNEAECEALLAGLRVVVNLGVKEVEVYLDSRLVANQVQGNFEAKDSWMMEVIQVGKGRNRHANSLATLASSSTEGIPRLIKVELVAEPSINAGFDSQAFREFFSSLGMKNRYSTLAYPQSKGQAEATNKAIVNGLKKRLEGAKGRWAEELLSVLWAYPTTLRRSTGETPFSLTYGVKAVILAEINLCSARVSGFNLTENSESMLKQLNLLDEHRESTTVQLAEYQQKLAQRYNRDMRSREFGVRDLVLRKVET